MSSPLSRALQDASASDVNVQASLAPQGEPSPEVEVAIVPDAAAEIAPEAAAEIAPEAAAEIAPEAGSPVHRRVSEIIEEERRSPAPPTQPPTVPPILTALQATAVSGTPSAGASGASPSLPGSSSLVPADTSPELPSTSEAVAVPPNLLADEAGFDSDDEDRPVYTLAGNKRVKPNPPEDA